MLPKAELLAEEEEDSLIENANCLSNLYARRKLAGFNLHKRQHIPENEYSGHREGWKCIYELIFESSTSEGQWFDVALLILISLSVAAAVLDSVNAIQDEYGNELLAIEIVFTFLFSVECLMRVLCIKHPKEYIFSLMGIVDATSILPTYLAAVIPSARPLIHLAVLRVLRVLRVFRVLKLVRFMDEASALAQSMHDNRRRIAVFLFTVFALILVIGCTMYLIEGIDNGSINSTIAVCLGERNGFSSIPISLYWTVVVCV